MFENRVLMSIFGPKRDEIICRRNLYNEELHSLHSSPDIIRMMKSRRMRWEGHLAGMTEKTNAYRILVESLKERTHYEDIDVAERIILKCVLERLEWGCIKWIHLAQDKNLEFEVMLRNWVTAQLLASQEGPNSM
jgi:hypothetical protein